MSSISSTARYVSAFLSPCLLATGLSTLAIGVTAGQAFAQDNNPQLIAAKRQTHSYSFRYVNPRKGNDQNDGSLAAPFRTITQAITAAPENTIIVLAPGTYSATTGEQFPIVMKSGMTIQGQAANRGQAVIIKGSGTYLSRTFARQNITLLGANRAGLRGVTVTNPAPQGYGLWIESTSPVISDNTFIGSTHDGVSIVGSSAPILKNNYFTQNGANGITIYGHSRPEIIENTFDNTGFGINIAQHATPRLIGNRVTRNKDGILVQGNAQPILRQNTITDNDRNGLVAISQSRPHLGNKRDPGHNQFARNGKFDVNAVATNQTLPNVGNTIDKTTGKLDQQSTVAVATQPVRQFASIKPVQLKPSKMSSRIGSDTTDTAKPSVTIPPIDTSNLPLLRLPSIPKRLAPKLRPVARPVDQSQIRNFGNAATSRRSLPNVPELRVSKPSVLGGTAVATPATDSNSIPIAVPSPAINPTAAAPANGVVVVERDRAQTIRPAKNILPVPKGKIPVGNVGSAASVWRSQKSRPTVKPNFKLRVYVPKVSGDQLLKLRELVPGAFNATVNRQSVIQVGAFNDRQEAEELVKRLVDAGLAPVLDKY
ncbi:DUF1565 domain-containing protein [filamentous cyanobacterium LEGE 11480]|uniref:DUF1565 domain-containing protein n=1 Tax=Romeriopsis navalis LEGE 11480 TaxID=2777977 RepID=A0A928Z2K2_9CYAN|nr:DUF1565 domain-containing protein [Romeriopsis navalis]MBE9029629.1 DUF1565 domain-containing protein [Romeriopsis navalis LEGE 11480]